MKGIDINDLRNYVDDPLPDETKKSFAAYCIYRDLGEARSLDKTAEKLGHKVGATVYNWSTKFHWIKRVDYFDILEEKNTRVIFEGLDREDHLKKLKQYRKENEELGKAFRGAGASFLKIVHERMANFTEKEKQELTIRDVNGLAKSAEVCVTIGDKLLAESLAVEKLLQKMINEEDSQ